MFNNYTDCSETCGDSGFKTQAYGCERNYPNATTEYVEFYFCDSAPAPNYTEPCNRIPCEIDLRYSWKKLNSFTECSETCGENGVQAHKIECERQYSNNTREIVEDSLCADVPTPDTEVQCNRVECVSDFSDSWMTLDPVSECSETCGETGFQRLEVSCERWYFVDDTVDFVDDKFCAHIDKPSGIVACNRIPCETKYKHNWVIFERASECSETCGEDGVQVQDFGCERQHEGKAAEYVDHSFCSEIPSPNDAVPCNRFPCASDYYHDWSILDTFSQCSETCGENGVKTSEYGCDRVFSDGSVEYVDHTFCNELEPPREVTPCNRIPCVPDFWNEWAMVDTFSECSQSCGDGGEKLQNFVCKRHYPNNIVEVVDDSQCEDLSAPIVVMPCNRKPCNPEVIHQWSIYNRTECTKACGDDGVLFNKYKCEMVEEGHGKFVEDNFCKDLPFPNKEITCNRIPCNFEYKLVMLNTFSACNESCGSFGVKIQESFCQKQFLNGTKINETSAYCNELMTTVNPTPCNRFPCQPEYTYRLVYFDTYSECSETCGEDGVKVQQYGCQIQFSNNSIEDVDDILCNDLPTNFKQIPCNRISCPEFEDYWVYLDTLTECSESCGEGGIQYQHYACERWWYANDTVELVDNVHCGEFDDDNEAVPCNRVPCALDFRYNWTTFNTYSDCSATCGDTGVKYVHFTCERLFPNDTSEYVNDKFCSKFPTPDKPTPCNRFQCLLNWTVGEWSECSKKCGMGVQTREVFCGDPVHWDENDVCVDDVPIPEKICNNGPCLSDDFLACKKDKYAFCKHSSLKKCRFAGFRKMCCRSCFKGTGAAFRRWKRRIRQKRRLRIKRRLREKRRENRILKYD